MKSSKSSGNRVRYYLGILLSILALNAFGGGYYGIVGAKDIPLEWLQDGPFQNYFIPSLFLFIVIGGTALYAAIAVFAQRRLAQKAAFTCGTIVLLWLLAQVIIIGYVSWLQPATAVGAVLILLLSYLLPTFSDTTKS